MPESYDQLLAKKRRKSTPHMCIAMWGLLQGSSSRAWINFSIATQWATRKQCKKKKNDWHIMMVNLHCQFNWINKCLGHQLATPLGVTMRVFPEKINCKNWSWVWGVEEVLSECCCWLNSGHVLLTQKPPCQGPQYFRLIEMSKPSLGKAQRNGKTFPW